MGPYAARRDQTVRKRSFWWHRERTNVLAALKHLKCPQPKNVCHDWRIEVFRSGRCEMRPDAAESDAPIAVRGEA